MCDIKQQRVVYHYCSIETFISIIKQSCIRMGNIKESNDSAEIVYFSDEIEKILKDTCISFARKHNPVCVDFFKDIDYDRLIDRAMKNDTMFYYAACFSSEMDKLSQWRGYADDGKGVAIGFYTREFLSSCDGRNLMFNEISYEWPKIKNDLQKIINEKLSQAQSKNDAKPADYENAINQVISKIVYDGAFYKNPAFKEEKEWRLVYYPFGNVKNLNPLSRTSTYNSHNEMFYDNMNVKSICSVNFKELECKKIDFKHRDNQLISYVDMDFSKVKNKIISDIVLGPKSQIDEKELKLFLMANGYNSTVIKIKKSKATYR